jgi:phosphohistidine phosphatase
MTKRRLVLVRHAKAAPDGADRDRPLAPRGTAEAPAIGRWLAGQQIVPDRVLVSPARRARQSWALAAAALGSPGPDPEVDGRVYDNTVEDLLEAIRDTPEDVATLAVVGHNPGLQELALALDDGGGDAADRRELAGKYPTSAVAVFAVADPWAAVEKGTLVSFAIPR